MRRVPLSWRQNFSVRFQSSVIVCRLQSSAATGSTPTVYNSLSKDKAPLPQLAAGQTHLGWYACGPTVYDDAHIGHARTYVCFDIIRRILTEHFDVPLMYCVGVTDIDDKILARALAQGRTPASLAQEYEARFFEDMSRLGVKEPHARLRVSQHMGEIVKYTETIVDRGLAYVAPSGSVYFDVTQFGEQNYGCFAPKHAKGLAAEGGVDGGEGGETICGGEAAGSSTTGASSTSSWQDSTVDGTARSEKRDPRDFALWKAIGPNSVDIGYSDDEEKDKDEEEGRSWMSPWGRGRPGWHIECSALTHSHFGNSGGLHIHSGGKDLAFPHHCNEVAQCEAHAGNPGEGWVPLWMHTGHVHIKGQKMSKSLKNFVSIREYLDNGGGRGESMIDAAAETTTTSPASVTNPRRSTKAEAIAAADDLRVFCLQYHYRSDVHYSEERMKEARTIRSKLVRFMKSASASVSSSSSSSSSAASAGWSKDEWDLFDHVARCQVAVHRALADDFNTGVALRALCDLAAGGEKYLRGKDSDQVSGSTTSAVAAGAPMEPLSSAVDLIERSACLFGLRTVVRSKSIVSTHILSSEAPEEESDKPAQEATTTVAAALEVLADFRADVRAAATSALKESKKKKKLKENMRRGEATGDAMKNGKFREDDSGDDVDSSALAMGVLKLCDHLRDQVLPLRLGIGIQDKAGGGAAIVTAATSAPPVESPRRANSPDFQFEK